MKQIRLLQQGDVLISSVDEIPQGKPIQPKNGCFVLAEGEISGHAHRIEAVGDIEFTEKDGMFYLKNKKPCVVRHEEHGPITIPAGTWKVGGVREFDHWAEEARRVID